MQPGMDQMVAFVRKHRKLHPVVIIDDISRLARDLMSYLILRNEIAEAGGELKSPKMNFSDDPTAQLPEKMMAVIVEHERIANANRSAERMKARLLNGYWPVINQSVTYSFWFGFPYRSESVIRDHLKMPHNKLYPL